MRNEISHGDVTQSPVLNYTASWPHVGLETWGPIFVHRASRTAVLRLRQSYPPPGYTWQSLKVVLAGTTFEQST